MAAVPFSESRQRFHFELVKELKIGFYEIRCPKTMCGGCAVKQRSVLAPLKS